MRGESEDVEWVDVQPPAGRERQVGEQIVQRAVQMTRVCGVADDDLPSPASTQTAQKARRWPDQGEVRQPSCLYRLAERVRQFLCLLSTARGVGIGVQQPRQASKGRVS